MRTAIYIENDVIQVVLTPDNEWEKKALGTFIDKQMEVRFFDGAFYDCRGGWTRQEAYYGSSMSPEPRSLIIRAAPPPRSEA